MLTPSYLRELRELCEKATPGNYEWLTESGSGLYDVCSDNDDEVVAQRMNLENAEFLIGVHAACPLLLDEIEEKNKIIETLKSVLEGQKTVFASEIERMEGIKKKIEDMIIPLSSEDEWNAGFKEGFKEAKNDILALFQEGGGE